jgi:hypothetical protein
MSRDCQPVRAAELGADESRAEILHAIIGSRLDRELQHRAVVAEATAKNRATVVQEGCLLVSFQVPESQAATVHVATVVRPGGDDQQRQGRVEGKVVERVALRPECADVVKRWQSVDVKPLRQHATAAHVAAVPLVAIQSVGNG